MSGGNSMRGPAARTAPGSMPMEELRMAGEQGSSATAKADFDRAGKGDAQDKAAVKRVERSDDAARLRPPERMPGGGHRPAPRGQVVPPAEATRAKLPAVKRAEERALLRAAVRKERPSRFLSRSFGRSR